jgi:hypothetical protein
MRRQAHHYVPQTYLRGFLDPTEVKRRQHNLWRYLPCRPPKAKGTKTVAQETDFYDLPELPPEENDLEEILAKIESSVAPHLASMRRGKLPRNQARIPITRAFMPRILSRRATEQAYSTRVSVQTVPFSTGPLTLRRCVNVRVLPSILNSYTS